MSYIKPALVVLVPLLNVIGQLIKKKTDNKKLLMGALLIIGILLSSAYGFLVSTYTGWKLIMDAVLLTGIVQGVLVTLLSFGTYDAAIKPLINKTQE